MKQVFRKERPTGNTRTQDNSKTRSQFHLARMTKDRAKTKIRLLTDSVDKEKIKLHEAY